MSLIDRDGNPLTDDWWTADGSRKYRWATQQRVAATVVGEYRVSTVWLSGIDHNHYGGAPLLFETMVSGGEWDMELIRYSTEEQAMRGHLDVLDRLRAGKPPFPYLEDDGE